MNSNGHLLPGEYIVEYGSRNITLRGGWVSSPNRRGTADIIWACVLTIFLSSWSVLCLNLPAAEDGFWRRARRKFQWTLLTIMGPEVIFQRSLGEWLVARRSHKAFQNMGYHRWTMTHSFYANMGGVILHTPDQGCFPVNALQLHWLLERGYIDYPAMPRREIQDKNKAEPVVRALTLGQTIWYLIQCVGRAVQGLALTTLELSTLAFISSAVGTFYCWYHKPMDVETTITIYMSAPIATVQADAGHDNDDWSRTPLDFIDRRSEWPWNIYWRWGLAVMSKKMHMSALILHPKQSPIERIPDDYWPEPSLRALPALFFFHCAYVAILMAGWNLDLPTYTELILWRVANCIQLGTIVSAWLTMPMQLNDTPLRLQKIFSFVADKRQKLRYRRHAPEEQVAKHHWYEKYSFLQMVQRKMDGARKLINDDPEWAISLRLLVVYETTWLIYLTARLYVVVEDIASLRAMPPSAYQTVNWSAWFPHI